MQPAGSVPDVTPFAAVVIVTSAAETTLQGALTGHSYLRKDWDMDTFDLKWPKTDATFYTDGWRCRIVWRQSGGMGGTIDNNQQCKKRVADSLGGAPYLLAALQARGYGNLVTEIEDLAATAAAELAVVSTTTPQTAPEAPAQPEKAAAPVQSKKVVTRENSKKVSAAEKSQKRAAPAQAAGKKPTDGERMSAWLEALSGSAAWEQVKARRAKVWQTIAEDETQTLALKAPAAKGKQEWVLKLTWSEAKHKAEYVVAENLRGVLCYLSERQECRSAAFVDAMLDACQAMGHAELVAAATAWREQMDARRPH